MVPLQLLPHSVPVYRLLEVNSALLKIRSRSSEVQGPRKWIHTQSSAQNHERSWIDTLQWWRLLHFWRRVSNFGVRGERQKEKRESSLSPGKSVCTPRILNAHFMYPFHHNSGATQLAKTPEEGGSYTPALPSVSLSLQPSLFPRE